MKSFVSDMANKLSERLAAESEENTRDYRGMSVIWALGTAGMTEATLHYAEKGHPITDPQTALSAAVTLGALGVSIFMNDRANVSRSER